MGDDERITWRELWASTAATLGDRAAARWLCEVAAACDGEAFIDELDEVPTQRMVSHLDAMVARRRAGEPLQYVLGRWGFRRLDLAVDRRVLIPRPETESVVEIAVEIARHMPRPITVADLGTGSGAIGLALADELGLEGVTVWLTDVSADALDVARANLTGIGRVARNVRIAQGSWFDALPNDLEVDLAVSNPPYVADDDADLEPIVREWEPPTALFAGDDGLDAVRAIVGGAATRLRAGGSLVVEIGARQGAAAAALARRAGLVDVAVRADLAGHDRVLVARRPCA
jgi:release factor glutamine methyltransferase